MEQTVLGAIAHYAQEAAEKLAAADPAGPWSYGAYWREIRRVATYFQQRNLGKNQYVLVKNTQNREFLALYHGVQLAGGICVPMEKSVNSGRALELAAETGAQWCITDEPVAGLDCIAAETVLSHPTVAESWQLPNPKDVAMILFTTGTTGKSKGIVITYGAEFAAAENVRYGVEMKADNVEILPMPMNHSYSLRRYGANAINGSAVIILDGVFFVKILFSMLEQYKVTSMALAPAAMGIILKLSRNKLADYADQLDYLQFGTAPLLETDKETMRELFPNLRLYNIYGATEMSSCCVLNFNSPDNQPNCIGYPAVNAKFKLVDGQGRDVATATRQQPAYLAYTGTMAMEGYFHEPELTAKTVIGGYLHSNDLGFFDEEGRVYMLGRGDDVILSGGNKISPLEVEEIAQSCEGVQDCICVGHPDPLLGAVPHLFIVAEPDLDVKQLEQRLANLLEDFKRPRRIQHIDAVPRTYNGKIDRKAMK